MKHLKVFISAIVLVCMATSSHGGQLKVHLKPFKEIKNSEFVLCIKRHETTFNYLHEYDTVFYSETGDFNIPLNVGRYILAMMHPSSSVVYYHVYVPEAESVVEVNVQMDILTIPEDIETVKVFTDLNNWDVNDAFTMEYSQKNSHWYLPEEIIAEKSFNQYYLVINGNDRTHIINKPTGKPNTWANYATIRKSNEKRILFDESDYKRGKPEHIITGPGADMDYHKLCETFTSITNELMGKLRIQNLDELNRYMTTYTRCAEMLDSLKNLYDDKYSWAFTDQECRMIELHHQNVAKRIPGAIHNAEFRSRFANLELVRKMVILLKEVKNNDLELSNFLIQNMMSIDYDLESCYLYEELNIPYGYFKEFLGEVLETSTNEMICSSILFRKARSLYNRPDIAQQMLFTIKDKYPLTDMVKHGMVDKVLTSYKLNIGSIAPDFELTSLDGQRISLSELKGKYVFLDFWGTWCGPCVHEIPNVKKLSENISADELVVVGVVCGDTEDKAKKFIAEKDVQYLNAMATENVTGDYGISSYPTTFLIDREGKIAGKNLRGEQLSEAVKAAMLR